jgi:hypothetical protein
VVFRPWNATVEVPRHSLPSTSVYLIDKPFETRHPHILNVTFDIIGGNDGTFGFLWRNSTVRAIILREPCIHWQL